MSRWLASFLPGEWRPEHYPASVFEQIGASDEARWCASVLNWFGPFGLGPTKQQALAALRDNLHEIARERLAAGQPMPRPGTGLPIEAASTARIEADPALLSEFIIKVLGFGADDPVFISDESCLCDFGDEEVVDEIRANIQKHFGLSLNQPEPVVIADVLEAIRQRR